ncbi:LOW QUALITY PROTEIN: hypothetical protein MAR_004849 [Mya arenaria]|uniref:MULE transposase domain-containing protein n=1 Tax=Mya arenaria TaxID=6604 RepID=A0ABY7F083_MYAAR|nr:LOW QUALITY PROTEIN: hypothetical protein MAR_004849 [Mya arenaria]
MWIANHFAAVVLKVLPNGDVNETDTSTGIQLTPENNTSTTSVHKRQLEPIPEVLTSTPNEMNDEEWQNPKRQRRSSEVRLISPVNLENRFSVLADEVQNGMDCDDILREDSKAICIDVSPLRNSANMDTSLASKDHSLEEDSHRLSTYLSTRAWEKSSSPATYLLPADGKLINLTKIHGLFCIKKSGRKFKILEPQPALQDLVVINRSYSKLKGDQLYKRRISWVTNTHDDFQYVSEDLMFVEYVGKFPGRGYHGKVKTVANKQPFIRSKPALKERAREMDHQSFYTRTNNFKISDDFSARKMKKTILGVDKTYNLGQLHLTTTVFKNLSVIRENPQSFLVHHFCTGNRISQPFFSHIASKLSDSELKRLVVGSDDEQALRKSIQRSFPGATHILCTRHLRNNVKDYLCHKIRVRDNDKNKILEYSGKMDWLTQIQLLYSITDLKQSNTFEQAAGFLPYLNGRIVPLIKNHVHIPKRVRNIDSNWTNNNAESMNNLLKIDMTDLIYIIYCIVRSMYNDVEKAIVSMGNYKLTQQYEHHKMSVDAWCQKTKRTGTKRDTSQILQGQRSEYKNHYFHQLRVPVTPGGGKKPHQHKRMAAERAKPRK